jgi:hypothetical protein
MSVVATVELREIADFIRGVTFGKSEACFHSNEGGIPILRAGNINDELILDSDLVWVPTTRVSEDQLLRVGDIAICMSSGSATVLGKTAQLRKPWYGSVGAFCGIIRPSASVHPGFLAHWFRTGVFREWRDGQARGANIQNLRFSQFAELKITLPSLTEQGRIASRLTEEMSVVGRARTAAAERLAAAQALPGVCLRQVFEGPEAKRWPTRRLGDIVKRHNEIVHPGDREGGEAIFVGLEHIEANTGRRTGSLTINLGRLTGRKPTFRRGQLVYGYLRPYLNKVWIAEFDGCSSVDQFAFDVDQELADPGFVAAFMRSETFLRRAEIVTTTGQLPRISIDEIAAVKIEIPESVPDQKRIATEFTRREAVMERLTGRVHDELVAIDALPAALLREAIGDTHLAGDGE